VRVGNGFEEGSAAAERVYGATVGVGNVGRGGMDGRLTGVNVGNGFEEGSVTADGVSGATVEVGNVGRGGTDGRLAGVKVGNGFEEGSVTADGVRLGTGVFNAGGTVRRGIIGTDALGNGVGLIRTGIDGDGRVLGVIETAGVGLAAAASATVGDAAGDGVIVGATLGDRRVLGEAEATGVGVAEVAAVGVSVRAGAIVAVAEAAELGVALRAGAIVAVAAALVAGEGDAAEVGVVSAGGTNFFGGAFGGGVDSVLILARARSAADRSETEVHPLSTFTSITRSFTRRGRKIFRTSLRTGTEIWSSFPCTRGGPSKFRSRRSR